MKIVIITLVLISAFFGGDASAASQQTWICLKNSTTERKLILVEDIDNYDWDGVSRPDRNWNGTYVDAGQTRCERAEVNGNSTTPRFTFLIPGRDSMHTARLERRPIGTDSDGWVAVLGSSLSEAILIGNGKTHQPYVGDYSWQLPAACTAYIKCSLYTIQDVP